MGHYRSRLSIRSRGFKYIAQHVLLLGWSIEELAARLRALARARSSGTKPLRVFHPVPDFKPLVDIKTALEAAGIEFTGTPEDSPGIRVLVSSRSLEKTRLSR